MNKVIFLDIDGVLTSARTGWMNWDIYATTFLKWVCEVTETKIVISSTWRCNRDRKFFTDIFGDKIIHEDWRTPWDLSDLSMDCRGDEIKRWLDTHQVEKYLIIDDDSDMLEEQMPYLLLTNSYNGIMWEDMQKVREYFNTGTNCLNMNLCTIVQHPNCFQKND